MLESFGYFWIVVIIAGVAAGILILQLGLGSGGRPFSYPGEALPKSKQIKRKPKFKDRAACTVEAGWFSHTEQDPPGDLLPHKVAGQHVWSFSTANGNSSHAPAPEDSSFEPAKNPNNGDCIYRAQQVHHWKGTKPDASNVPKGPLEAARKGYGFYEILQADDGQWPGDYGGPHFLLPGFVIAAYITGMMDEMFPAPHRRAVKAYLLNHQQEDGGWGTHIESPSTMFGSVLNYVALRLIGADAEEPACKEGRKFLKEHGGALYAPSWAKFWLAVLGVYEYEGLAPVPSEMWLLPHWSPIHPGRFWCHARMVYLPMCWLYARRFAFKAANDPVVSALRSEIYCEPYSGIDWGSHVHSIADIDNYSRIHWGMKLLQNILMIYERLGPIEYLRKKSMDFALEYMHAEDLETNYLTIGPVSKALHIVVAWVAAGGEKDPVAARECRPVKAHVARVPAYLWVAEDGMRTQGYNGSMAWDTSFAAQGIVEAGLAEEFAEMSSKAFSWLVKEQVRALPDGDWKHWRQAIRGGWGFSTAEQAWPVSDTTAEAFKAVLLLRESACVRGLPTLPDEHLFDSVQFLLSYQNADGGWATYENNRGWKWYEIMNPSEVFGDIMIDYSYIECSSSSMQALMLFSKQFPNHRREEILEACKRGKEFIEAMQRDDGSWYGCWGNCFTYGCWFGIEGLIAAGDSPKNSKGIQKCIKFLLSKQNEDGGWGEDFASCFNKEYTACSKLYGCDSGSTVVQTAWALLALMAGNCEDKAAVQRGIQLLMRRQLPSGDWAQENVAGVFNRSVGITYTAFRNVFPLWALGRFAREYGPHHGLPV
eukprot:TRINITY_DN3178_c0_g1_i1.p1 TRINITY_DN3178_c0_g1~~TRINITY_DN3178_c0_g1_i1.p1  ORF type:complete len:820 (+),score=142.81 TRINITY_DN3178_c0_g1_i1:135-2594(+)